MESQTDTWIESSDVLPMFPTFVWKTQISSAFHEPLNARILDVLEAKRGARRPLAHGEAWQSDQALHESSQFRELNRYINATAACVLEFLRIGSTAFEVTACWANIYAPGASHKAHSHPNNFLSGVYYVKTGPGADTINFHDPRTQTAIIRPPVTQLTAENTDQVVVEVRDGALLLFPSYLQHSVDPNQSDTERVSLSFNIMFTAFTERLSKPLW